MNDYTCGRVFEDSDVGISDLLIRHGFAVLTVRTSRMAIGLHELVGIPSIVFCNPGRDVVRALPKHELNWSIRKTHNNIRLRPDASSLVPNRVELQARVESPKFTCTSLPFRKLWPECFLEHPFVCCFYQRIHLLLRKKVIVYAETTERTLKRVFDRKLW